MPPRLKSATGLTPVARMLLHARKLAFTHPLTGRAISVESALPEDFQAALARLRHAQRHH